MKIMCVFGTRPEAIKMCPLVKELNTRPNVKTIVCVSGQHKEMLSQVLDAFRIVPDYNLNIMKKKQDLFDITSNILLSIKQVLLKEKPDLVLVHGDTSTAFVTALSCFYLGIKVGHVEAGLRTYNLQSPFPEEFNREAISLVANYHFSPTEFARDNLIREGKNPEHIYVTGNTGIDALKTTVRKDYKHNVLDWVGNAKLLLITAHRRENLGEPMRQMFKAILKLVENNKNVKAIYPVHLNPAVREIANEIFADCPDIMLCEPMDVIDFHNLMAKSYIILTDSGGIQEEAPSLHKPVLVMRNTTERQEGVRAGVLKLIGTSYENIYNECNILLNNKEAYNDMIKNQNPYGDGYASKRISDIICDNLAGV